MEQNEQVLELSQEQLEELMEVSDKLPPIEIPMEWFDEKEFQRGIDETSYVVGVITALFNAGLSESSVMDFIINKENINYNKEANIVNRDMNIEIAKNQKIAVEKNEL